MILRKSKLHINTIKQTHAAFYKHLLSYEHLIAVQVNFKIKKDKESQELKDKMASVNIESF